MPCSQTLSSYSLSDCFSSRGGIKAVWVAPYVENGFTIGESGTVTGFSTGVTWFKQELHRNLASLTSTYNYDELYFETRGEAEDVLDRMREIVSNYGIVSVADLYELAGVVGNYTDQRYGWTGLRNTDDVRTRYGYQIRLPRAMVIE